MTTDAERMYEDYGAAFYSGDVDRIASFYTDDCLYEIVPTGQVARGKEELKAYFSGMLTAIPDIKFDFISLFFSGDWIGCEYIMSGTQTGATSLLPATGKSFSIRAASVYELKEGKFKRAATYYDLASLLRQLGLMP